MNNLLSIFINSREAYDKMNSFIEERDLDINSKAIYKEIAAYYDLDAGAKSVDKELLKAHLKRKYAKFSDEFEKIIDNLPDISESNVIKAFLATKRELLGDKLMQALNTGNDSVAKGLMDEWQKFLSAEAIDTKGNEIITEFDIEGMVTKQKQPEFRLRPKSLNDEYGGGADRGEHVIIFGRPNSGKSLLCLNNVAGWISDGHKILYIGNEDRPDKLIMRLVWRLSGMTKMETLESPRKASKKANARGLQKNLIFAALCPGTFSKIKSLIEEHEPDIVVLDQIRNIDMKSDGLTEKLESAAIAARNIAKYYEVLFVSVTQAGASGSGKLVLEMEDIDSSKTGIQAAADLIIGVGSNESYDSRGMREISTPKNKEGDDHFHVPVRIDTQRTKVSDI